MTTLRQMNQTLSDLFNQFVGLHQEGEDISQSYIPYSKEQEEAYDENSREIDEVQEQMYQLESEMKKMLNVTFVSAKEWKVASTNLSNIIKQKAESQARRQRIAELDRLMERLDSEFSEGRLSFDDYDVELDVLLAEQYELEWEENPF